MNSTFDLPNTPIESGITLIEASAGTGKTFTITGLVLRLLLEEKISSIDRVLIVTFTTAATEELKSRVREALREALAVFEDQHPDAPAFLKTLRERHGEAGQKRLREALLNFDLIGILTIHGFCNRVLKQSAFESGMPFSFEFVQNDSDLRRRAGEDFWRREVYSAPAIVADLLTAKKWHPTSLQGEFKLFWRDPDTRFLPEALPLTEAKSALVEALDTLRAHADQKADQKAVEAALSGYNLNKRSLPGILKDITAVFAYLDHGTTEGLTCLEKITEARLEKARTKQSPEIDHPFFTACYSLQEALDEYLLALRLSYFHRCKTNLEAQKRDKNLLAFDDLLHRLSAAVADQALGQGLRRSLQQQYQAALIDEFQDTDQVQYQIFRDAFRDGILYLIGDPKQAIYSFRGADIFAYLEARQDAAREYTLDTNWRSHSRLIAATNQVFATASRPFAFAEIPFHPVLAAGRSDDHGIGGEALAPLQWRFLNSVPDPKSKSANKSKPYTAARGLEILLTDLSNECVRLLSSGLSLDQRPLQPRDIAVLVKTNKQAQAVQDKLRAAGIPTIISQAGDIFASREMEELRRILRAIHEPRRQGWVRAALGTEIFGLKAADLASQDERAWQAQIEDFELARSDWKDRGFIAMAHALLARHRIRERLLGYDDGERRLTNLLHGIELIHSEAIGRQLAPESLLHWIESQFATDAKMDDGRELRLESDRHAVQVVTMHKSKGLEYEIVFCLGLGTSRVPTTREPALAHREPPTGSPQGGRTTVLDYGSPDYEDNRAIHDTEALAEGLRLAYVAMTRAKQRCYLLWGDIGKAQATERSELTYLLHQQGLTANPSDKSAAWAKTVLNQCKDHSAWPEVYRQHIEAQGQDMAFTPISPDADTAIWQGESLETPEYKARAYPERHHQLTPWRITSFSALTSDREAERPDHQDPATDEISSEATVEVPASGIFAFARGARAGTCLHEVFEHCDFKVSAPDPTAATKSDDTDLRLLVQTTLTRYGLDQAKAHRSPIDPVDEVCNMVRAVLLAEIPGLKLRLTDLERRSRFDEWPFFLGFESIVPAELSELFAEHGEGLIQSEYAPQLKSLSPQQIDGYLTGFVDLICERDGRYFVFDWKSNHLGNRPEDYGPDKMWTAMLHHHYVLQYHLYCLALHRYLKTRLGDGYDYEEHCGGAAYAFLRGIGTEPELGWYVDRPPKALITALDQFFAPSPAGVQA